MTEIVYRHDLVAAGQQIIHQMGTEKSRPAGHDRNRRFATRVLFFVAINPAVSVRPLPRSTTQIVRQRIWMSSHNDQLSMYSKSIRTQSLKSFTSFRPDTCHGRSAPA